MEFRVGDEPGACSTDDNPMFSSGIQDAETDNFDLPLTSPKAQIFPEIEPSEGSDEEDSPANPEGTQPTSSNKTLTPEKPQQQTPEKSSDTDGKPKDRHDEDVQSPEWRTHEKHVFIISSAGKPIFSRYGNEENLASLMGVMQALSSFVQDDKDELMSFTAGKHRFVYQHRGPLLLVMVASTGESEAQLSMQLNYVYSQIIFVLTYSQLTRIFSQRQNYDLRRMLSGTEKFIDNLLDMLDKNPSFFLGAVRCLPLACSVRDKIAQVFQSCRTKDLVFAVLIADNQLITLLRPKKYSLHPADLHLIFNLVSASSAFNTGESWTPLCLPKFNNTGFLHAHVSYIDDACTACLLLISNNRDAFFELSGCRAKIVQSLSSNGCLQAISQSLAKKSYRIGHLNIPDLRHFLYKSRTTAQFTSPAFEPPYNLPDQEQRLFRRYQYVHHRIHSQARPLKIYYHGGTHECLLGWVTSAFELYAAFGPLTTKNVAIEAVMQLIRWMKREEDKLFIVNSQTFELK
eukprot:m.113092 g.113092  ORF g.113092 m.113092 type:complete len:515 (+) comp22858_c0_seq6:97-1641(+)